MHDSHMWACGERHLWQVFKRLFNDGLSIQKERIRELRKYAEEQRQQRTQRQQEELEALEN